MLQGQGLGMLPLARAIGHFNPAAVPHETAQLAGVFEIWVEHDDGDGSGQFGYHHVHIYLDELGSLFMP